MTGAHDDLVTALALATLEDGNPRMKYGGPPPSLDPVGRPVGTWDM